MRLNGFDVETVHHVSSYTLISSESQLLFFELLPPICCYCFFKASSPDDVKKFVLQYGLESAMGNFSGKGRWHVQFLYTKIFYFITWKY